MKGIVFIFMILFNLVLAGKEEMEILLQQMVRKANNQTRSVKPTFGQFLPLLDHYTPV